MNGRVVGEAAVSYTTTWNDCARERARWTSRSSRGIDFIRLEAVGPGGLGNIDYFKITGEGVEPAEPRFTLSVAANDPAAGSVARLAQCGLLPCG